MDFLTILQERRSIRKYTGEHVSDADLQEVLEAGLLSQSSRGRRPWELIVVRDREVLEKLSHCRDHGAAMLADADCAILVFADAGVSDVWTEDCSIVMSNMHIMADSLGLGSCWIQGRLRVAEDGRSTEDYFRELLGVPERFALEAILSLGDAAEDPEPHSLEELDHTKIHYDKF